jgi:hypothetical protein
LAREEKQLALAKKLYEELSNIPTLYASSHADEYAITLAEVELELGNQEKAEKLCNQVLPEYRRPANIDEPGFHFANHVSLLTVYSNMEKLDVAEELLKCLDTSWIHRDGRLNQSIYPKLRLLRRKGNLAQLDEYKKKILSYPLTDWDKLLILSSVSIFECAEKDYDRAAKVQLEMQAIVDRSKGEARLQSEDRLILTRMQMNMTKMNTQAVVSDGESVLTSMLTRSNPPPLLEACTDVYVDALRRLGKINAADAVNHRVATYLREARQRDPYHYRWRSAPPPVHLR